MKTRLLMITGIIVVVLVSLLVTDQYYLSLQDQEIKKSDWVENCAPPENNQIVPSIGLYNHTHSFDLLTCTWNPTEHGAPGFLESLYTSFIEPIFLDIAGSLDIRYAYADCGASTLQFQYDYSDHVFHGSMFGKKPITDNPHQIIVVFSVNESFKGIDSDKIPVKFGKGLADEFEYGREYVMFAHGTKQPFSTHLCTSPFFAFPTILKIVSQLDNPNNDFGDVLGYDIYDQLTEAEKNQLEDISPSFAKERQKERDRLFGQAMLIGIPSAIGIGVTVMWVKTMRTK